MGREVDHALEKRPQEFDIMSDPFGKKTCLLTGGSGQLGLVFSRMFAGHYDIASVYCEHPPNVPSQITRLVDPLEPTAEMPENQHSVYAIQADLRSEDDLQRVVEVTLARFGRIDLLVNAAAYACWAPMLDGDRLYESFLDQFELNAYVPLRLGALVAEKFWKNRFDENRYFNRSIVNVSSTAGVYIYRDQGQSAYSASKAALNYLTMHMAEEFHVAGVRVNAIAPTSFPRLITTESVANGIYRLSEGTSNGRIMVLDVPGESWL
jgi:NAD(P)-dependent dehydrogenase (short-subunit alcohol dehydrogenase family)